MIGKTLGRYKILRSLAGSAAGERYLADDTARGRTVVLKVFPPESPEATDQTSSLERSEGFRKRARAIAALSHPNVMTIDDFGEDQGVTYLVTELLEGLSLRERLQERRLSLVEAIEYARRIADGLAAAHARGILHRDLKPEHIFITKAGKIKVLDFGLTEASRQADASQTSTVSYRSPEQAGGQPGDERSDVFSFGAILYEMLSGKPAFSGASAAEAVSAITDHEPPELAKNRSLPASVEKIVKKCLSKNPDERFPSAQEVAVAIDELSEEKTTERPPVVDDEPSPKRKWKFFMSLTV